MVGSQFVGYGDPVGETSTDTKSSWWSLKRLLMAAAAVVFVAVAAVYGVYYWKTGRFLVSTDDAYVETHSVLISPKVSGYISEVPVDDNEYVKAGQVLARIDPRDFQTALDQARANVAAAEAGSDTLDQQIGSKNCLLFRTANRSFRIGRHWSSRSRTTSATPSWRRPASAPCRGRSRRKLISAKKRRCCSTTGRQ